MSTQQARQEMEAAGDRVRDAATDAAHSGIAGVKDLLDFHPLQAFGISVSIGGLIAAVMVVVVAFLVSLVLRRALRRYGERNPNADQASLYTVSRVAHYLLLVIGVLLAFELTGIPINKFAVFAGAVGVGLGFGLQAIFSNFISGLILLFDRSLKVGDFVELDGDIRGTVRAINIRATRVTTNDNIDVLVPNSEFVTQRVVNWTHGSVNRRMRVSFGVDYGVDKELVKKAALEAASRVPFTLAMEGEKRPQVWLVNFGDNAIEYVLAVWLTEAAARRNAAVKAAYLWELDSALKEHGIALPFPQRDLHLRSAFGLEGAEAIAALRGDVAVTAARPRDAAGPAALPVAERAVLSRNDAQDDAERILEEDAAREAQDKRDAAERSRDGRP